MPTLLSRWWRSQGHGVHSPLAYRIITNVLDWRDVAFYPEHRQQTIEDRIILHLHAQLGLDREVKTGAAEGVYHDSLICCDGAGALPSQWWDCGNVLWHRASGLPEAFVRRTAGIMIDYGGGQLLVADRKLFRQDFYTRIRI